MYHVRQQCSQDSEHISAQSFLVPLRGPLLLLLRTPPSTPKAATDVLFCPYRLLDMLRVF